MLITMDEPQVMVDLRAECHGCKRFHDVRCTPDQMFAQCESWEYKHSLPSCDVRYVKQRHHIPKGFDASQLTHEPWYLNTDEYKENTNFQLAFNASAALTVTSWASLATDTSLLAGASSAVVDNGASATLLSLSLTAVVKLGTSPTAAKEMDLYVWTKTDDSTYPDTITGSDATITITSQNVLNGFLVLAKSWSSDATSNRVYPMQSIDLFSLLGNVRYWGVWLVHNTAVNLNASGSSATQKQSYVVG